MAHDILIVDDEPYVRKSIAGILEDGGYAPRDAADGVAQSKQSIPDHCRHSSSSTSGWREASSTEWTFWTGLCTGIPKCPSS